MKQSKFANAFIALFTFVAIFIFARLIYTPSTSVSPPVGWVRINTHNFIFYAPPDMQEMDAQGIDSYVGKYKNKSISLSFDYGRYSNPMTIEEGETNYISHMERIDGKIARIASFNSLPGGTFTNAIGIYFPDVALGGIKLTVFATCKTTNDYETVLTIFRTIKF